MKTQLFTISALVALTAFSAVSCGKVIGNRAKPQAAAEKPKATPEEEPAPDQADPCANTIQLSFAKDFNSDQEIKDVSKVLDKVSKGSFKVKSIKVFISDEKDGKAGAFVAQSKSDVAATLEPVPACNEAGVALELSAMSVLDDISQETAKSGSQIEITKTTVTKLPESLAFLRKSQGGGAAEVDALAALTALGLGTVKDADGAQVVNRLMKGADGSMSLITGIQKDKFISLTQIDYSFIVPSDAK